MSVQFHENHVFQDSELGKCTVAVMEFNGSTCCFVSFLLTSGVSGLRGGTGIKPVLGCEDSGTNFNQYFLGRNGKIRPFKTLKEGLLDCGRLSSHLTRAYHSFTS
ncbi:hypothetical protein FRX31_011292 [Thalictrum thalictroides]|uniref:Uncharacterized protein n=1 Tax=Thalictrum thalictroides TaxID=46969 RepID=A0A7J6WP17_THATH|nr:hypothetical protein FRX31_011292 [Thalictrum thalictroides]